MSISALRFNAEIVLVVMGVCGGRCSGNGECTRRDTITRIGCARDSMCAHLSGGVDGGLWGHRRGEG